MPQIGRDREGDLPNSSIGLHLHSLLKYGTTYGAMRWGSVMARTIGRLKAVTVARAKTPGTLAEARERAQECRKLRVRGIDPIETRRAGEAEAKIAAASAISFQSCAES